MKFHTLKMYCISFFKNKISSICLYATVLCILASIIEYAIFIRKDFVINNYYKTTTIPALKKISPTTFKFHYTCSVCDKVAPFIGGDCCGVSKDKKDVVLLKDAIDSANLLTSKIFSDAPKNQLLKTALQEHQLRKKLVHKKYSLRMRGPNSFDEKNISESTVCIAENDCIFNVMTNLFIGFSGTDLGSGNKESDFNGWHILNAALHPANQFQHVMSNKYVAALELFVGFVLIIGKLITKDTSR